MGSAGCRQRRACDVQLSDLRRWNAERDRRSVMLGSRGSVWFRLHREAAAYVERRAYSAAGHLQQRQPRLRRKSQVSGLARGGVGDHRVRHRATADWQSGEIDPTRDGVRLRIDKVTEDLDRPTDAAFAPDGRLFITERTGRVRVVSDGALLKPDALVLPEDDDEIQAALSIAIDPDFARTQFVFILQSAATADGPVVRLARYREFRGKLAERASLFQAPASDSADPAAVVRFGPDGKLYVVVSGDNQDGRLFRMNQDGTLPRDQAGTTPAVATGVTGARGLAWAARSAVLWIVDDDSESGHLSAFSLTAPPIQAIVRGRTTLRPGVGSMAVYTSDAIPEMRDDALIVSARPICSAFLAADDPTGRPGGTAATESRRTASSRHGRARWSDLFLDRHGARQVVAKRFSLMRQRVNHNVDADRVAVWRKLAEMLGSSPSRSGIEISVSCVMTTMRRPCSSAMPRMGIAFLAALRCPSTGAHPVID